MLNLSTDAAILYNDYPSNYQWIGGGITLIIILTFFVSLFMCDMKPFLGSLEN